MVPGRWCNGYRVWSMVIMRRCVRWSGKVVLVQWISEDLQCKENDRKSKIGGHWRVSDG